MPIRAVIVVPSQGRHVEQFRWSALALKKSVYHSRAEIVSAEVGAAPTLASEIVGDDSRHVGFSTEKGKPFSFRNRRHLRAVITISHAGPDDGPNLLYGAGGYQPWQIYGQLAIDNPYSGGGKFDVKMLRPKARAFWKEVGQAMAADGKIIMVGCRLGKNAYIDLVANASGRKTYGPTEACSAGDVKTVVRIVKTIEHGGVPPPMREAKPGEAF
jgi:hypothetical protein